MALAISDQQDKYLYQKVISAVLTMREEGSLQVGDKLPSLRSFSHSLGVSIPTVRQAYLELERLGVIEAKPKSGYFLKPQPLLDTSIAKARLSRRPREVNKQSLIEDVFEAIHAPGSIPLGVANPSSAYSSDKALARWMRRVLTQSGSRAVGYGPMDGYLPLKRQIAYRYIDHGLQIDPAEVIITNGAQEAIAIALQCVAEKGDIIAVESPTYFGVLELIESLGMKALEIPLCPKEGVCVDDLSIAISNHSVKAAIFSTSVSNPVGSFLTEQRRRAIVQLLESNKIPLIEDDVYGDLYFGEHRGKLARCHSTQDNVLTCSSFSKTAAPGYRIGWLMPGKHLSKAKRIKRALSCSSSLLNQWTLSEFVGSGEYDRSLRMLRHALQTNKARALSIVHEYFPEGTRVNDPQGGSVLWIELPKGVDGSVLFQKALDRDISIAPGILFSLGTKYSRFIRVSFGVQWGEHVEQAFKTLADLTRENH